MATPAATPEELAAQAAAAAAAQRFTVEAFTLLAVGLAITILRTYARVTVNGGFKGLQLDDYLAWFAAVCSGENLPQALRTLTDSTGMLRGRNGTCVLCR